MAEPGAVLHVVAVHDGAGKLLKQVALLVEVLPDPSTSNSSGPTLENFSATGEKASPQEQAFPWTRGVHSLSG